MPKINDGFSFRVTKTQRLIAANALTSLQGAECPQNFSRDELIDLSIRMMVTIQAAGFTAYFLKGLKRSWWSRNLREPRQVDAEEMHLRHTADRLNFEVDHATGKAACRIRENRARRERELMAEPDLLHEDHPEAYMLH